MRVDLVEVFVEPPGVEGRLAEHVRQVDVVDRQHFADDVEDAVGQNGPHLFELFEQAFEDAALDDGLAFLGVRWRRN